jgi:hypothetical protein
LSESIIYFSAICFSTACFCTKSFLYFVYALDYYRSSISFEISSMSGSGCFVNRSSRGSSYFAINTDQGTTRRADTNAIYHCAVNMDGGASSLVMSGWCNGTLILTAAQTFGFRIAQRSATDASNPAIMSTGCYIKYTKIA